MPWRWSPHGTHPLPFGTPVEVDTLAMSGTVLSYCGSGKELTYTLMVDPEYQKRIGDDSVREVPADRVREWRPRPVGTEEEER